MTSSNKHHPLVSSVLNDYEVGKGGWAVENVSKSDYIILGCSLIIFLPFQVS